MSNFTSSQFLNLVNFHWCHNSIRHSWFANSIIHKHLPKSPDPTTNSETMNFNQLKQGFWSLASSIFHERWMLNFKFRILNICFDFLIYVFLVFSSWKRNIGWWDAEDIVFFISHLICLIQKEHFCWNICNFGIGCWIWWTRQFSYSASREGKSLAGVNTFLIWIATSVSQWQSFFITTFFFCPDNN